MPAEYGSPLTVMSADLNAHSSSVTFTKRWQICLPIIVIIVGINHFENDYFRVLRVYSPSWRGPGFPSGVLRVHGGRGRGRAGRGRARRGHDGPAGALGGHLLY